MYSESRHHHWDLDLGRSPPSQLQQKTLHLPLPQQGVGPLPSLQDTGQKPPNAASKVLQVEVALQQSAAAREVMARRREAVPRRYIVVGDAFSVWKDQCESWTQMDWISMKRLCSDMQTMGPVFYGQRDLLNLCDLFTPL